MEERDSFYIDDHAVLFANIVKAARGICGEKAENTLIKSVKTYGRERGQRMALRCLADGRELTCKNFILYGEWEDPEGWSKSEPVATEPNYKTNMTTCGWYDTWQKYGLLEYGKLYCEWVDENLVHGFNPELTLKMESVMSHTGKACEFNWVSCHVSGEAEIAEMAQKRQELIPFVTKDFLFHCAHLLSTFQRMLCLEFGLHKGLEVMKEALSGYTDIMGEEKMQSLVCESRQNFMMV